MALTDLVSFVRVMQAGSVSAASRELGIPRPTLSRRISRLEEHYGVRLVHRSTRALTLTDAGQEVFQHGQSIVNDLDALDATVRNHDGAIRGLIRVSGPANGSPDFDGMYSSFLRQHPEVRLEIVATSRRVDLVAERIDVAIRGGGVGDDGLIGRRLHTSRSSLLASKDYLTRKGIPKQLSDLAEHDLLLGFGGTERVVRHLPLLDGGQVAVRGRVACNDLGIVVHMVREGMGIGFIPEFAMRTALTSGDVVRVLKDLVGHDGGLYVLYADRRYVQPQVRAFVEHATAWIGKLNMPPVCPDA